MSSTQNTRVYRALSHYRRVVAFAVLGCCIGGVGTWLYVSLSAEIRGSGTVTERPVMIDEEAIVADPLRLRIPSAGIDTLFSGALGVNADGTVEVPEVYDAVGWYKYGPKPGAMGPAVVLGHVDSKAGPAVFYSLGNVQSGDRIEIDRVDGTTAIFEVIRLDRRLQSQFPTKEVYSDIDHAGLRLITCTGTYDHGKQVYSHNLIVYAKMVSP